MDDAGGSLRRARRCRVAFAGAVALVFAWAATARAQTAAAPTQTVRFSVFSAKPIEDLAWVARPGGVLQKLVFQPTARSARAEYRGPMPLRFVDAATAAVVAEATIPAGLREVLLLFTPAAPGQNGLRYQVAVLEDSTSRQAPGTLAILNLSGLALDGVINTQKMALKAGLNPPVPVVWTAKITLSTTVKGRSYQSFAGSVTLGRSERALLVLFPPFYEGAKEVQSRMLVDLPPGSAPPLIGPKRIEK